MTEAEEEGEGIGGGDHYEESGCRAWMALALYIAQSTIRLGRRLQNTDEMMGRGGRIVSISHLSSWLEKCMPSLFLKTLIGLQGCNKGDLFP